MRHTVQRQIILNAVQKVHKHLTAEDVYQDTQKDNPSISKSTVYRNLHRLVKDGAIRLVLLPDSPERFDARLQHHYHFSCNICKNIFDVDMDYLSQMNSAVQAMYGFQVDDHDVIFKGICAKCKAKRGD